MRPRSLPLESITSSSFQTTHPANCIKMNTYKSASKQTALSPFKINTYTKTGGGGPCTPLPSSSASDAASCGRRSPASRDRRFRELRNRRLRPCRRDSVLRSPLSAFNSQHLTASRHRDEMQVTASPLDSALTNRGARNPFRFRSYENGGCH
jgi:hypothetical protein